MSKIMRKTYLSVPYALLPMIMAGCSTVPESIVHQPANVRPQIIAPSMPANGAIFQSAAYRPMFEDRRARLVGDVLTISISERTSAGKSAANATSKTGSVEFGAPTLFGIPATTTAKAALGASGQNKFEDKGSASSSNTFSGTITATVIEVLPNGNLVVSGEKQIAFDKGIEYVRFSGVVSPDTIAAGNVVPSTQVADARVEYRTNTRLDKAEVMSQLARFFLSIMPL
ncbi:flagellar basal body L-ring protein FlgH [Noviherbaspirillum aerium]|uniref:flagellar basal body L-ring protein FlgH n=1 Tax=Noviherbaspirillum aerium TaxID=2588497 RepID=UPI00124C6F43|nr:flagellar basal body L-ring protein FlgH [Noviherbaspirillum aerium]